jgi:hypothetical protein
MPLLALIATPQRRSLLATASLVPAIALATFALPSGASPSGARAAAVQVATAAHASHGGDAMAGMDMSGMTMAEPAAAEHAAAVDATATGSDGSDGAARTSVDADAMGFEVGSPQHPLVTRGPDGPLWASTRQNAPGSTSHGTFAAQTVARQLDALRAARTPSAADDEALVATRSVLTTAQATKKLSKSCQRLLKKRKSKLGKSDRKKRTKCLEQRRRLVAASKKPASSTPGVTAPAPTTPGPTPTPTTPAPTTPAPTTPTGTTPGATEPAGPVYGAVGVTAIDGNEKFKLTRGIVSADIVNFELSNSDRQNHNLWIVARDASGNPVGTPVVIYGSAAAGSTQSDANLTLAPGDYTLYCTVAGHGPMAVKFVVTKPAS